MVKELEAPPQPLAETCTVIVATTADEVVLVAVKEGTFPVPDAARPMDVLLLDQVIVLPETELLLVSTGVTCWLQNV